MQRRMQDVSSRFSLTVVGLNLVNIKGLVAAYIFYCIVRYSIMAQV
jgi:hypothetical protein